MIFLYPLLPQLMKEFSFFKAIQEMAKTKGENEYLDSILQKYNNKLPVLLVGLVHLSTLKQRLKEWAGNCLIEICNSGSYAKGTAIKLSSDIDYLISLKSDCNENNGGLQSIYNSLYERLCLHYKNVRKQNVSFRLNINGLEVDVTPARKHRGNTNNHWLFISKKNTWKQTNIQKHINDISQSGRIKEIKLFKIWRELHKLDFPSIYLEYLIVKEILIFKPKDNIESNFWSILENLAQGKNASLGKRLIDPANSSNILSDLLTNNEKDKVVFQAKKSLEQSFMNKIIW